MIFVCVGSRKFQFDRLLKKIDELIDAGIIQEKVYAQIGASTYKPKMYAYKDFLSNDDFRHYQNEADLIVTHGGTGAVIGALKLGKQVIVVPRLSKYKEHSDDHQLQVAEVLENEGYLRCVLDIDKLGYTIIESKKKPITKVYNKSSKIISIIEEFIEGDIVL